MSGRPVRCGNCSNANMDRLSFSPDGQYVICGVCGTSTRLYDSYIIQEHTGEVKISGFRTFDERIKNGNTLLQLGKFSDAEVEFRALTKEYASKYESWFGLARAVSQDFSSLDQYNKAMEYLEYANTIIKSERQDNRKLIVANKYYSELRKNKERLDMVHQKLLKAESDYKGVLFSPDGVCLEQKKRELERYDKEPHQAFGIIYIIILIVMIGVAIICFNGAAKTGESIMTLASGLYEKGLSNEEIETYISQNTEYMKLLKGYYVGRIVSIIATLLYAPFFFIRLRSGFSHIKNTERITLLQAEIEKLTPLVDARIQESEHILDAARHEVALCEQEMSRLKNSYMEERSIWL